MMTQDQLDKLELEADRDLLYGLIEFMTQNVRMNLQILSHMSYVWLSNKNGKFIRYATGSTPKAALAAAVKRFRKKEQLDWVNG